MMVDETTNFANEAEATRDRIAATVEDLQSRLSPRNIVNNAVGSIGVSSFNAIESVRASLSSHPLVLATAGLGIGITLLARSKIGGAKVEYGDSYAAYADYDDNYADRLAESARGGSSAKARLGAVGDSAHNTVDDNPLAVLIVGIATGALLGAIVPMTDTENRLLGPARTRFASAARAATDAMRDELDVSKFSLTGGTAGLANQASAAIENIAKAARDQLTRKIPAGASS